MAQVTLRSYDGLLRKMQAPRHAEDVMKGLAVLRRKGVTELSVEELCAALNIAPTSPEARPAFATPKTAPKQQGLASPLASVASPFTPGPVSASGASSSQAPSLVDAFAAMGHKHMSEDEAHLAGAAVRRLADAGVSAVRAIASMVDRAAGKDAPREALAVGQRVHVRATQNPATVDGAPRHGRVRVRYDDGSSYHARPEDLVKLGRGGLGKQRLPARYRGGDVVIVVPGGAGAWRARTYTGTVLNDLRHQDAGGQSPRRCCRVHAVLVRGPGGAAEMVNPQQLRPVKAFDPDPLRVGDPVRMTATGMAATVASGLHSWGKYRGTYQVRYDDGTTYHVKRRALVRASAPRSATEKRAAARAAKPAAPRAAGLPKKTQKERLAQAALCRARLPADERPTWRSTEKKAKRDLGCDLLRRAGERVYVAAAGCAATIDAPIIRSGREKGRYRVRYDDGTSYHVRPDAVAPLKSEPAACRRVRGGDVVIVLRGGEGAWRARTHTAKVVADLRRPDPRAPKRQRRRGFVLPQVLVRGPGGVQELVDPKQLRVVKAVDRAPLQIGQWVRVRFAGDPVATVASGMHSSGMHRGRYQVRYPDGSTYHVKRRNLTAVDRRGFAVGDSVRLASGERAIITAPRGADRHRARKYPVRFASGATCHLRATEMRYARPARPASAAPPPGRPVGQRVHVHATRMPATIAAPLAASGKQKGRYRVEYDDGSSYHVRPEGLGTAGKEVMRARYCAGDRVVVLPPSQCSQARPGGRVATVLSDLRHLPQPDPTIAEEWTQRRVDVSDGLAYMKAAFIDRYAGTEEWDRSPVLGARRWQVLVAAPGGTQEAVAPEQLRPVRAWDPAPLRVGDKVRVRAAGGEVARVASKLNSWGKHRGTYQVQYADGSTYHVKRRGLTPEDRWGFAVGDKVHVPFATWGPRRAVAAWQAVVDAPRGADPRRARKYRVRYPNGATAHVRASEMEVVERAGGTRPAQRWRAPRAGEQVRICSVMHQRFDEKDAVVTRVRGGVAALRATDGAATYPRWLAPVADLTRNRLSRKQRRAQAAALAAAREAAVRRHRERHAARTAAPGDRVWVWAIREAATVERGLHHGRIRVRYADRSTYHVRPEGAMLLRRAAAAAKDGGEVVWATPLAAGTRVHVRRTHAAATVCAPGLLRSGPRRGTYRVMYDDGSTYHVRPAGVQRTQPAAKEAVRRNYRPGDRVVLLAGGVHGTVAHDFGYPSCPSTWQTPYDGYTVHTADGRRVGVQPEQMRLRRACAVHSATGALRVGARVWVRAVRAAATVVSKFQTRGLRQGTYKVRYADGSTYHVKPRGLAALPGKEARKRIEPGTRAWVTAARGMPGAIATVVAARGEWNPAYPGSYCVLYDDGSTYHVKPRRLVPLSAPCPLRAGDVVRVAAVQDTAVVDAAPAGGRLRLRYRDGATYHVGASGTGLRRVARVAGRYAGAAGDGAAPLMRGDEVYVFAAAEPAVVDRVAGPWWGAARVVVRYGDGSTYTVPRGGVTPLRDAVRLVVAAAVRGWALVGLGRFRAGQPVQLTRFMFGNRDGVVLAACGAEARAVGAPGGKLRGLYTVRMADGRIIHVAGKGMRPAAPSPQQREEAARASRQKSRATARELRDQGALTAGEMAMVLELIKMGQQA